MIVGESGEALFIAHDEETEEGVLDASQNTGGSGSEETGSERRSSTEDDSKFKVINIEGNESGATSDYSSEKDDFKEKEVFQTVNRLGGF